MSRHAATTDQAPSPAGPYSQSIRAGNVVVCAGQAGAVPAGELLDGITAQTEQCLHNVLAALAASGAQEEDIVRVNVYLTDVDDFAAMNEVYARTFSRPYPARTTVYVTLPAGMLIEIDAMAVVGSAL
ncbi:MAG TPA: Rid family detoxifying hydrolase [Jatrophihabitans sp.]|nr:Rid family detoxifying hydrolase [Jatrophihabitans sp.]